MNSNELKKFEELLKEVEQTFKEKEIKIIKEENQMSVKETEDNFEEKEKKMSPITNEKQILIKKSIPLNSTTSLLNSSELLTNNSSKRLKNKVISQKRQSFEEIDDNYDSNDRTEEQPIKRKSKRKTVENIKPNDMKKRVICEYVGCGKDFSRSDSMKLHYRTHCSRDEVKDRVFCEYVGCSKHFSTRDNMRAHYRTHFLEKSLECEVKGCDYRTWERRRLTNHMNVHKGIRPHVCTDCGKSFGSKPVLRKHIQYMHSVSEESNRL